MSPWEKVGQLSRQTPKTFVENSATPSRPRGLRESHDDHMMVPLTSFIVSSSMSCNSSMLWWSCIFLRTLSDIVSNILLYLRGRNKEEERKGRRKNKKNARIDESIHVHVFFGENWPNLKRSKISETEEATPTKIGLHAFHINLYLHGFFELILFFDPHGLNKVHGPKGSFGRFQGKGKRQNLATGEAMPTKIGCVRFTSSSTCMNFLSQFYTHTCK